MLRTIFARIRSLSWCKARAIQMASAVLEVPRMKKKLRLHRTTIAILSGHALYGVIGGVTGTTEGASVNSVEVSGKIEPCQLPVASETCGIGTRDTL
jgi:hypothetical protein